MSFFRVRKLLLANPARAMMMAYYQSSRFDKRSCENRKQLDQKKYQK